MPAAAEHACQPDGDVIRCFKLLPGESRYPSRTWNLSNALRGGSGKNGNCFVVVELILQDTPPSPLLPSVPFPRKSEPALSSKTAAARRKRKKSKNVWIFGFSMTDQLGQARMPKKKTATKKEAGHVAMCNPPSTICPAEAFFSSPGNASHVSAPAHIHPRNHDHDHGHPTTGDAACGLPDSCQTNRQSVNVGQLVTATGALQPYAAPLHGLPCLPDGPPLRNRVERPIRTTAIPPCHWPCCTSCAASPSNPNSPRSLMRRFCVMTIHVRRSLGCRSCRRAKNLTPNWSPRRRPPVETQPPPPLGPADFIHRLRSRNLQTPSAYRHAGAYQAPFKRRPLAAGGCFSPPLTPRWWWLDPNISRRDYHLRHRASIGHRHGRDPPPPSAETPSQSCHEALPFGHVSSHYLIDLETKSVTDDTKCPIPTTRLQPKLPT